MRLHPAPAPGDEEGPSHTRILAALAAARYHGFEPDADDFHNTAGSDVPSPADLVEWLREAGLWARATRMSCHSWFFWISRCQKWAALTSCDTSRRTRHLVWFLS